MLVLSDVEDGGSEVVTLKSGVLRLGKFVSHLGGEVVIQSETYYDTVSYSHGRVVALYR